MKLKEMKAQNLAFAHAQSGMGGVRFTGCKSGKDYWKLPDIENAKSARETKMSSAQIMNFIRMQG